MSCQEEQQEEIETIGELIENFAGDLVGGTYSNGSDERDYPIKRNIRKTGRMISCHEASNSIQSTWSWEIPMLLFYSDTDIVRQLIPTSLSIPCRMFLIHLFLHWIMLRLRQTW